MTKVIQVQMDYLESEVKGAKVYVFPIQLKVVKYRRLTNFSFKR